MRKDWIRKRQRKTPPISGIMKLANQTAVAHNLIGNLGTSAGTISANRMLPPMIAETIESVPSEGFHYALPAPTPAPATSAITTVSNGFYSGEHNYGNSMFPAPSYIEPEMMSTTTSGVGGNIKAEVGLPMFESSCALAPPVSMATTSSSYGQSPSMFFYGPCPSVPPPYPSPDHFLPPPSQHFPAPSMSSPCSMSPSPSVYQFDK